MTKPPRHYQRSVAQWIAYFAKLETSEDRIVGIMGGSLLENSLALAIVSKLVPLDEPTLKQFFENDSGFLSTFSDKIPLGFMLNLYGRNVTEDLNAIRRIRNHFAHDSDIHVFYHPEIAKLCDGLHAPTHLDAIAGRPPTLERKDKYLNTLSHLCARFDLELHNPIVPDASKFRSYD